MIREPYNLNPYNSTMDVTENPTFSFTFGGDALSRAQVIVAKSNSDGTPLFISGIPLPKDETLPSTGEVSKPEIPLNESNSYFPGIRNGDFVSISLDDEDDDLKSKLINNRDYIWKLRLTENNAGFHNWCHFSKEYSFDKPKVFISKEEYTRFFVRPVSDKYERPDIAYKSYKDITKKLQDFFQAFVFFQNNYYKVWGVAEDEENVENVELILHTPIKGEYKVNDSFLLFTNVDVTTKQNTYATQTIKTGSAINSEEETGIVLTKDIPYEMSRIFKFESGVFTSLSEHGKLYASTKDYVIMNDNARIRSIDAETVVVDIPSSYDLTKGAQAAAVLVLENIPCKIKKVEELSSEDPALAGYYRFTCEKNKDFVAIRNDIVNYEIRGWDYTIEDYQDILVEVQKKAYKYENVIFAIGVDEFSKQRVIAYEEWEYSTGDLKGFIYYSDFHLYRTPLEITPGTTFKITSNFYDSSWYYFQARRKPSASITCFNGIETEGKITISQRIATFQGFYNGNGIDTVKTHRWIISNEEEIIYDSGAIYDGDLTFRYEDFSKGGDYLITLEIISQSKEVCSTSLQLYVDPVVEDTATTDERTGAEILDSYQAIRLTWPGLLVTNSKMTSDCTVVNDGVSGSYLHIPKNNYILFDTIGADDFTIGPPAFEKGHHFKMRLKINDDLQFYNGDIFILRNSKTGDFISLYKEGSKILFKTPSSSSAIQGGELLTSAFGLQEKQPTEPGYDYQWKDDGTAWDSYLWTETFTNTNIYTWDIALDINETYITITLGKGTVTTVTHQLHTSFDNIYFNGDINLYYFAYGIGKSGAWSWGNDTKGVPRWTPQSTAGPLSLDVQFIFKPSGEHFVSNPQADDGAQSDIAPIEEYVIYRQYPNHQKKKLGSFLLRDELIGLDSYSFIDWTCQNYLAPTYEIVPIDTNGIAGLPFKVVTAESPEWYYWTFMGLTKNETGHYYPSEIWNLHLNLAAGSYVQNLAKTYHQGFSMTPKVSLGPSNYMTTSLQGLLIDVKPMKHSANGKQLDTYEITYADSHKIEEWRQFVYSSDLVLVKDVAGHIFIASLSNPQYTINDVGVITAEVSFDITQIGDINDYQIFISSAAPKEDRYGIL